MPWVSPVVCYKSTVWSTICQQYKLIHLSLVVSKDYHVNLWRQWAHPLVQWSRRQRDGVVCPLPSWLEGLGEYCKLIQWRSWANSQPFAVFCGTVKRIELKDRNIHERGNHWSFWVQIIERACGWISPKAKILRGLELIWPSFCLESVIVDGRVSDPEAMMWWFVVLVSVAD